MAGDGIDRTTADLQRLFAETRGMLDSMRSARPNAADRETPTGRETPPKVRATAAGGQLEVTMSAGRLESVWLDPDVMRLSTDQLGAAIVEAVNAALAEASGGLGADVGLPVDPEKLAGQLRAAQDASMRQMSAITEAMSAVVERLGQAGQR